LHIHTVLQILLIYSSIVNSFVIIELVL